MRRGNNPGTKKLSDSKRTSSAKVIIAVLTFPFRPPVVLASEPDLQLQGGQQGDPSRVLPDRHRLRALHHLLRTEPNEEHDEHQAPDHPAVGPQNAGVGAHQLAVQAGTDS